MTLIQRIDADYTNAFKRHETVAVEAFRLLKTALKNAAIEHRHDLSEEEALAVVQKEAKRRRESIDMFTKAGRQDLADHEAAQLQALEAYLPAQMDDAQLTSLTAAVIAELGATAKDFGKVMSGVMAKVKGQADGTRVSVVVKQLLK